VTLQRPDDSRRALLREVRAYTPDSRRCAIDLSDNTNQWGAPPAAARAAVTEDPVSLARYPEAYTETLKTAIASYAGVPTNCVVTGCGSDDILDLAIRAFAEPGGSLVLPDPAFVMIPSFARLNGLTPVAIPLTNTYDADVDAMLSMDAAVVYLCSPNNPTGTAFSRSAIEETVERARGLVLIDEAYFEFSGASAVDLIERSERVLIVRTMSKAFGLASIRIGYGIGAAKLAAEVEKSRGPYKVSSVAARIASAALTSDLPWVTDRAKDAIASRMRLVDSLAAIGLTALPSAANFLLVPVSRAGRVAAYLRERDVAVRPFVKLPQLSPALAASGGDALRITVGPQDMMEALIALLEEALVACA
jgi:histidinol-phosphate aminotransferase